MCVGVGAAAGGGPGFCVLCGRAGVGLLADGSEFKFREHEPMSIDAGEDFPQEFIMDITPVNWSLDPLSTASATSAISSTQDREVVRAVAALNKAGLTGDERQLVFQRDAETQKMVIRLVDRQTSEVISQIPPEYVLRLAEDLKAPKSVSTFG